MTLYNKTLLRKLFLPVLSRINWGNFTIKHHYTKDSFYLHSYLHKGYWYHGKNRELATMKLFSRLISPGQQVIEVGGHIGYISLYFSKLVGEQGQVHVFEPGPNNLPYLRKNTSHKPNITVIEKGVGNENKKMRFYIDNITGQNNSFIENVDAFESTKSHAYNKNAKIEAIETQIIRMDDHVSKNRLSPNFIKIDVENYECEVVKGMLNTISEFKPVLMIEVAPENKQWIFEIMKEKNYIALTPELKLIQTYNEIDGNTFFEYKTMK